METEMLKQYCYISLVSQMRASSAVQTAPASPCVYRQYKSVTDLPGVIMFVHICQQRTGFTLQQLIA